MRPTGPEQLSDVLGVPTGVMSLIGTRPESAVDGQTYRDLLAQAPCGGAGSEGLAACQ